MGDVSAWAIRPPYASFSLSSVSVSLAATPSGSLMWSFQACSVKAASVVMGSSLGVAVSHRRAHALRQAVEARVTDGFQIAVERSLHQAPEGLCVRRDDAVEQHLLAACDQERGEILDVERAQHFVMVFDIDPGEARALAECRRLLVEQGLVFTAGPAPLGAQAGHEQGGWVVGRRRHACKCASAARGVRGRGCAGTERDCGEGPVPGYTRGWAATLNRPPPLRHRDRQ